MSSPNKGWYSIILQSNFTKAMKPPTLFQTKPVSNKITSVFVNYISYFRDAISIKLIFKYNPG